jgi:hypothetical protein
VNERGKVMDVHGGSDTENRNIIAWKKHNGLNQQWDIVYADEYPGEPGKGELNSDFGLYVERPFYIVSEMKSHRLLEKINGSQFGIKTRNGRQSQVWWFDQRSLTIRCKEGNQSFAISGNGGQRYMQLQNTNSNWW